MKKEQIFTRLEDLEEAHGIVARVLDVVAVRGRDVADITGLGVVLSVIVCSYSDTWLTWKLKVLALADEAKSVTRAVPELVEGVKSV